ncbi:MAG TPA: hypothetical protein VNE63_05305 [Candidatus Acidoferrales bacterium]|nr:hypothetical protein [Candidatus Acidoferrales bacterium]
MRLAVDLRSLRRDKETKRRIAICADQWAIGAGASRSGNAQEGHRINDYYDKGASHGFSGFPVSICRNEMGQLRSLTDSESNYLDS